MRVLFYDDAPDYGGHEAMMMEAIAGLAERRDFSIALLCHEGNKRLIEQAARLAMRHTGFVLLRQQYCSGRMQLIRHFLSLRATREAANKMLEFRPDVVVVAQGGISYSSIGLKAAKWIGVKSASYIPMTHPESTWTASVAKAWLREHLSRFIYRLPDSFITISPRMAKYLQDRGLRQPVIVVQNGIDFTRLKSVDRAEARAVLGLPETDRFIGMVGRVDFSQKCHNAALAALPAIRQSESSAKLLIVGDGPDLPKLKQLADERGLADAVLFLPWQSDPSLVYSAMDLLLLPSRYEGVPLVMLEAIFLKVPVAAAAIDGMLDLLPHEWLFANGDTTVLTDRVLNILRKDASAILVELRSRVIAANSIEVFREAYVSAILAAYQPSSCRPLDGHLPEPSR